MKSVGLFLMALSIVAFLVSLMACEDTKTGSPKMINSVEVSKEDWNILTQRRIAFGHQSIGNNILSGMQALAQQARVSLPVNESKNANAKTGIMHFKIGINEDPYSKITDFEKIMESNAIHSFDIAMMKLCYIDFNNNTDAIKLAEYYSETIERLGQKFPNTFFIAVTSPITVVQEGPRGWIKKLLGRTPGGYIENYKRKEFNDYLRSRYNHSGHLFDLAKYENSSFRNYTYREAAIEVLNPSMTSDGGHLNSQGQQYVAANMIKILASIKLDKNKY